MRTFYVYIMASRSRVLYVGVTNDLIRRVNEHKGGLVAGFTTRYRITRLVYFEEFADIRDAIAREKELKGWVRRKKVHVLTRGVCSREKIGERRDWQPAEKHVRPPLSGRIISPCVSAT